MEEPAWPIDASSLIYLAKSDAFDELRRCVGAVLVPPAVWHEAVEEGERIGASEVSRIRAAEGSGIARRVSLSATATRMAGMIREEHRLGRGESEVLALTKTGERCIVDEGRASRVARSLGLTPVPTLLLPVLGYRSGGMSHEAALALIRRLAVVMSVKAEVVFAVEDQLRGER
jgi:predicted nucleic acid-binding protein